MGKELVIGLDLGTTSVKAVMFNRNGKLIAEAEEMIRSYYPQPEWVEQNPREIEKSAVATIRDVVQKSGANKNEILAIGISCAMHSLICVDEQFEPLSQMLIWADGRASQQADHMLQTTGRDIYLKTGTPIHPMSPFLKLVWMKETHYEPYLQADYFMSMKEYLLLKWFGTRVIDYSMASASGLMNLTTLDWDTEALEMVGVERKQLSAIVPPTEALTGLKHQLAEEMGLHSEIPVVIGAADGQLANLGSGAINPGEVAISVGTSGAIRQFIQGARISEKQDTFSYAFTKNTSIIGGPTNNGGIALQWLKDLLNFEGSHEELISSAARVEPGADGIIFLPYVNGERAPLWNRRAKGNFYGLSSVISKSIWFGRFSKELRLICSKLVSR